MMLRAVVVLLLLSTPAYAYLDPGTGSIVAQVAIAAMLGIMFQAKMIWRRLKNFMTSMYHRRKS